MSLSPCKHTTYQKKLMQEALDRIEVKRTTLAMSVHKLLQILFSELSVSHSSVNEVTSKMRTSLDSV